MTARAKITQAEITRALKAAMGEGVAIGEIILRPDGSVSILPTATKPPQGKGPEPEAW